MTFGPAPPAAWATSWCIAAFLLVAAPSCSPSTTPEPPPAQTADSGSAREQAAAAPSTEPAVYRGAGLAHLGCPQCHDIGIAGAGPAGNPAAPAFVSVANQPDMSAAKIQVWMRSSHPTMPGYYMDDRTNSDLAAYIMSLRRRP